MGGDEAVIRSAIDLTVHKTMAVKDVVAAHTANRPWTAMALVATLVGAGVYGLSFQFGDTVVSVRLMGQAEQGARNYEIVKAVRAAALAECSGG